ncbi:MAG TPA: type II CAAX endopeptidase family protein [Polyangiaceae bacterium]
MPALPSATTRFFVLTFAITWGLQLPGVFAQRGLLPGPMPVYLALAGLGIFGPMVAATVLAFHDAGGAGARQLYTPLLRWRVHPGWYVVAVVVPGLLFTLLLTGLNLAGRAGPTSYFPASGAIAFALVISVAEEVGWRGYALPRLEQRFGAFAASTLLGVIWYLWHLPMFVGQGRPLDLVLVKLLYFTGASLMFNWIYKGTNGSLLLAVLTHVGGHLNNSFRALPDEVAPLVAQSIIYAGLGLCLMRRSLEVRQFARAR